jgi:3-oxoacyl-[acyl-carrier protein] reductase
METDITASIAAEDLERIRRRSPLHRLPHPEDVAGAVAYLVGPDGASVTGTTVTVDAGSTA